MNSLSPRSSCRTLASFITLTALSGSQLIGQEIDAPAELIFSGVKSTVSAAQAMVIVNQGTLPLQITSTSLVGTHTSAFRLVDSPVAPLSIPAGGSVTFNALFQPGLAVGSLSAALRLTTNDADEGTLDVGLYGLSANGEQGSNEPTMNNIVKTLGYGINVGGTGLLLGTGPGPIGDEVLTPLFRRAGTGPVTIRPVARYSPDALLDFGYYTRSGGLPVITKVATIDLNYEQCLNPAIVAGGRDSFDPGTATFGLFTGPTSYANRYTYSEDALNAPPAPLRHAARMYPLKNSSGVPIPNSYLAAFEPASNGDYQDYVFVVTNVKPAIPGSGFTFEAEDLAVENSSGDFDYVFAEPLASAGEAVKQDSNAVNDYLTLRIPNVAIGTYQVKVRYKMLNTRGIVQLLVGKVGSTVANVGSPIDLYSSTSKYQEFTIGTWTSASTSDKQFRFKIVGKNAGSRGFTQAIDSITLIPQ